MMHEPEKSAVKPPNNAERSAAELVEPRTGTKGNANQQSTRRAQDRESVSQALERVRLAARRGKKEKFTSLLHHADPEMLQNVGAALPGLFIVSRYARVEFGRSPGNQAPVRETATTRPTRQPQRDRRASLSP